MKVFIGFENISSTVTDITNSFRALGHECYTAVTTDPSIYELNTADFNLQKEFNRFPVLPPEFIGRRLRNQWEHYSRRRFFERCARKFDLFIFLWSTFYNDYSDLEILKQRNKKVVFVFAGDDARWRNAASQEFRQFGLSEIPVDNAKFYRNDHLLNNLTRIRHAEKFADLIFSRLDQAQIQLRPFHRWNMMVDPGIYKYAPEQRQSNPVILHAPTARITKGTDYLLQAFERLRQEGLAFTPLLIENTPHAEALKLYENADIVVDQLIIPGSGKFASEGLAMGKVVVSQMGYQSYPQKNPAECPIVDANIHTIYEVLKALIVDHDRRKELAARGRVFAEQYLKPEYFCNKIIRILFDHENIEADYQPEFFRKHFKPEAELLPVYNEWTSFVKSCDWYKQLVPPGTREGLIF